MNKFLIGLFGASLLCVGCQSDNSRPIENDNDSTESSDDSEPEETDRSSAANYPLHTKK